MSRLHEYERLISRCLSHLETVKTELLMAIATGVILLFAVLLFAANFGRLLRVIASGAKPFQFPFLWREIPKRVWVTIEQVFLHKKLMRQKVPGLIHLTIFWGFVVLTLGTLEWITYGFTGSHWDRWLPGFIYGPFALSQDLFNGFVLLAVLVAFYRRLFVRPKRMADNAASSKRDAYLILSLILGLVLSNLLTHATYMKLSYDAFLSFKPIASLMAFAIPGAFMGPEATSLPSAGLLLTSYYFFWWVHLLLVLVFLNYLPFSKHLHVIVAGPNVFFSKMAPRGQLTTPNLEDESITKFGAEKVEELSWKSLFDSYACTECGRCNEFCPTATTGKDLKPKTLMIQLRAATTERGPALLKLKGSEGDPSKLCETERLIMEKDLAPGIFSEQFVWDCTTCGACVEACPVMIDHVDTLVEMRRALVLNKGANPDEATNVFRNWEAASNPWGLPESTRQEWLIEKGVPQMQDGGDFEYLYYVGCAGSFDDRNKKVVDAVIKILQAGKVKFGILGKEERCNGETARRLGNEWLAQQMMKANNEILQKYQVRKIITSCPHCFNTLANEYPAFGSTFEVFHHTEIIEQLVSTGRVQVKESAKSKLTYHDSCYLGRYNDVYDAPRVALSAVSSEPLVELKRSKEQGFCCGAGGGRMWLEETTGTRINQNRTEEIVASGAEGVGVGCPFCMTMISDGLKSQGREDIPVKDIAEWVSESLVVGER